MVRSRVAAGWLVREHRGSFRLAGAPDTPAGRALAAILAVDGAAGVTERSGLELHGVLEPSSGRVHLACDRHLRPRPGVVLHRRALQPAECTRVEGIRVASVARCLADLAGDEAPGLLATAVREAEFLRLLDPPAVAAASASRPGSAALDRLVRATRLPVAGELRHDLERRFAELLRDQRFPTARVNHRLVLLDPWQEVVLDVVWREAGLAVELDGRQAHLTPRAFEADRDRDRRVAAQHDLHVVRVTWRQLEREPQAIIGDLWTLYRRGVTG